MYGYKILLINSSNLHDLPVVYLTLFLIASSLAGICSCNREIFHCEAFPISGPFHAL